MGIDARILIRRVPTSLVNDDWLVRISWALANSIGHDKFWIHDGLPAAEYEEELARWEADWQSHPLRVDWKAELNWPVKSELRNQIIADIGERPLRRQTAIAKTCERWREDGDPPSGTIYLQDGPDIMAAPDECLLEVNLWGRYYGPCYERGDILSYCAIAEWLEVNIPGCQAWYGGDSSGVLAEPFDAMKRLEMKKHLYSVHGRDYFKDRSLYISSEERDNEPRPKPCSLCPSGNYCGERYGWGTNFAAFNCAGCGRKDITRDNGVTWTHKDDND